MDKIKSDKSDSKPDKFTLKLCRNTSPDIFPEYIRDILDELEAGTLEWSDVNEHDTKRIVDSGIFDRYIIKPYESTFV